MYNTFASNETFEINLSHGTQQLNIGYVSPLKPGQAQKAATASEEINRLGNRREWESLPLFDLKVF